MTTYTDYFNLPKPAFGSSNWHTDMYAMIDSVDALLSTFIAFADMQGAWTVSTAYTVGQTVLDQDVPALYECLVAHTSAASGTFSADRTANPTYWQVSPYSARALAEKWADEEEDVAVETGKFSAKHWAAKAAATVGAFGGTLIEDADADTFVKTEASADEDKVRITTAGVARVVVDAAGLDATALLEAGTTLSAKYAAIAHVSDTANPHSVTKTQVGLSAVSNALQLVAANNLSDVTTVASARSNLGLGALATLSGGSDGQIVAKVDGSPVWATGPRNTLSGFHVTNNGTDAAHDIDIATGVCQDSTNVVSIVLSAALTKRADAVFAEGTAAGGMVTGESLPTSGTIHVWAIAKADGTADVCFNNHASSALSPALPTGFTVKRRIASLRTDGSANILGFVQDGDHFQFLTVVEDVSATNPGTSAVLRSLSLPAGSKVLADLIVKILNADAAAGGITYLSDPDVTDTAAVASTAIGCTSDNTVDITSTVQVRSNTASQIRTRAAGTAAGTGIVIGTRGWFDTRGRDA